MEKAVPRVTADLGLYNTMRSPTTGNPKRKRVYRSTVKIVQKDVNKSY